MSSTHDDYATTTTQTNHNAWKAKFLTFVQHPDGLDQPLITTVSMIDTHLCLKDDDLEKMFYDTGHFFSFVLKFNGKPYEIKTILMWFSAQLAYVAHRPDTKDRLGRMVTDTHGHYIPVWLTTCRSRVKRKYEVRYIVEADDVEGETDDTEAMYSVVLGSYMEKFLVTNSDSFELNAGKRFTNLLQYHNCGRGGELRHCMWSGQKGAT
jgi:hypothetical protein